MKIESKFNINDLVQHKFQQASISNKLACCFEIIEVKCIACYTTSQIFYVCRAIHAYSDFKDGKWKIIDFAPGHTASKEYCEFREDELKMCDVELSKVILLGDAGNKEE